MRMPVSVPTQFTNRKTARKSDAAAVAHHLVHIDIKDEVGMPCWYFDKQQLRDTPSIRDGIPFETERRYRREGARFIMNCGNEMTLGHNTMATGVVYFHRFYMFHSFKNFPRYVTACCCLFLAGKVEETPKKCRDIIRTARELLTDNHFYSFGEDPKEEVMTLERILLQTIKFDLQVEHPYTFLLKYAKCFKGDQQKLQKMVQMAWNFVNDSLSTVVCLQWEPEIIAVALIHLASKLSKFTVVDWNGRQPQHSRWWEMFVAEVTMDILEDICHQVLDLYQNNQKDSKSPPSPPQLPPSRSELPKPAAAKVRPSSGNSSGSHSPVRKLAKLSHSSSSSSSGNSGNNVTASSSISSSNTLVPATHASSGVNIPANAAHHGPNNTTNHIQPIRSLANPAPIPTTQMPHQMYRPPPPPANPVASHIQQIHSIYTPAPPPPPPPVPQHQVQHGYGSGNNAPSSYASNNNLNTIHPLPLQPPPPPPYPSNVWGSSSQHYQPMPPPAAPSSHSHMSHPPPPPQGGNSGNYYHLPQQHHSRHPPHHMQHYGRQQRY